MRSLLQRRMTQLRGSPTAFHRRMSSLASTASPASRPPPLHLPPFPVPSLPAYRARLVQARPGTDGLVVSRFLGGARTRGKRFYEQRKGARVFDSVSFIASVHRRGPSARLAFLSAEEEAAVDERMLPGPAVAAAPASELHTQAAVMVGRRGGPRLAVDRVRARRRMTAALTVALRRWGVGGKDVYAEPKPSIHVVAWEELLTELRTAFGALGIARRRLSEEDLSWTDSAAAGRRRSALWWRRQLRGRWSGAHAPRDGVKDGRSARSQALPMCLAVALHSRVSPSLPSASLLSHLRALSSLTLFPPVSAHLRYTPPLDYFRRYVSKAHRHQQRRHVLRLLRVQESGWREVADLVHVVMDLFGRDDSAEMMAEVCVWYSCIVHVEQEMSDAKQRLEHCYSSLPLRSREVLAWAM